MLRLLRTRYIGAAAVLGLLLTAQLAAQTLGPETGNPLPRFESLRFDKVNMRAGPGTQYPIRYVFQRSGLPVQVFREYGDWREVRDPEGAIGWIKRTQLSRQRTAFVTGESATFYRFADEGSRPVVRVGIGMVLELDRCAPEWCEARARGYRGWVRKDALWGVTEEESFAG